MGSANGDLKDHWNGNQQVDCICRMDTAHDGITELEDGIEKLSQDPGGKKREAGENEKKWRE